jgi:hypothetical protein
VVTSPRAPFIKTGELQDGEIIVQERESRYNKNSQEKIVRKKIAGGSAEGPRHPGLSRPPPQGASKELFKKFSMPFAKESAPQKISRYIANSVRNKSAVWRNISQKHRKFSRTACRLNQRAGGNGLLKKFHSQKMLVPDVLVAAEKLVALDGGNHADGALVARLGPLNAAKATHAHGTCEGDLVGQSQKDFDGRAFPEVLGKEEIHTAGTHVAGLGGSFANGRTGGPAHGEGQAHLKALGGTAFGATQRETSWLKESVAGSGGYGQ